LQSFGLKRARGSLDAKEESIMHRVSPMISFAALMASVLVAAAQTTSPYAGQEQRQIKALSDDEIRDLMEGKGMGFAKAAELNSYPGPLHVMQFAKELDLSNAQRGATEALYADMHSKAQRLGMKIIEAERNLDRAFADRRISATALSDQVNEIATLRGQFRLVHLETHLAQRMLLTPEQIDRYDMLRGYMKRATHKARLHGDD
jgi:Spy/CpxP family protein refolding chaperone